MRSALPVSASVSVSILLSAAMLCLLACTLTACATYAPHPLPAHADLAAQAPAPRGRTLDMPAIAMLAVMNNPQLRAERAASGVARAVAFAAGLLPDPQLSFSADHPIDHVVSPSDPRYPEYNAYAFGLSFDLQSLWLHGSNRAAADAGWQQSRLELLWQEWQTIAQARTLYAQACIAATRHLYLTQAEPFYTEAARSAEGAQQRGDISAEDSDAQLALLVDLHTRLGSAERSALQAGQQLRALLGLSPSAALPLAPLPGFPVLPGRDEMQRATARLAERRPDLLALQQGYRAQEQRLRAAVLAQFPDISLGPSRARDVSNVHTWGGALSLTLPLFDRGRGNLAVQRATREQLRSEYQSRLDEAVGDAWQLWNELQQLDAQRRTLEAQLPQLQSAAQAARSAWQHADLAPASYLTFVGAYLDALDTHADLTQSLWSDSIALAAELGTQAQPSARGGT